MAFTVNVMSPPPLNPVVIKTSLFNRVAPLKRMLSSVVVIVSRESVPTLSLSDPPLRVMPVPVMTSSEPRSRAFPDVPSPIRLIWLTGPVSPVSVSA